MPMQPDSHPKSDAELEATITNALDDIFQSGKTKAGQPRYPFRQATRDYSIPNLQTVLAKALKDSASALVKLGEAVDIT